MDTTELLTVDINPDEATDWRWSRETCAQCGTKLATDERNPCDECWAMETADVPPWEEDDQDEAEPCPGCDRLYYCWCGQDDTDYGAGLDVDPELRGAGRLAGEWNPDRYGKNVLGCLAG